MTVHRDEYVNRPVTGSPEGPKLASTSLSISLPVGATLITLLVPWKVSANTMFETGRVKQSPLEMEVLALDEGLR